MLELQSVYRSWKDFSLNDVSFKVYEGDYFIVLGPSGAGKTLLLEIIAGIFFPYRGRIIWKGKDITFLEPEKRGFAYVPQNYALFPHMTVYENIAYGLEIRKLSEDKISNVVKNIASVLNIEHLLERRPSTLSGGEAQRVAIARGLAIGSKFLLLDEPFANLDPSTTSRLILEMKVWKRELGLTVIHVTHSFEEALLLGDRVGVMLDGRMSQVGSVKEVFSNPRDENIASFLGFENIIEGMANGELLEANGVRIVLPTRYFGRVRIAVRSEDIILSEEPFRSSLRNMLEATVVDVMDIGGLFKVTLDVGGLTLKALVTRSSAVEIGIQPGKKLFAGFKATAVHVFEA